MGGIVNLTGVPDFDQLEVVKEGSTAISLSPSANSSVTISHNLGYVPIIFAFLDQVGISPYFTSGDIPLPTWISLDTSTPGNVKFGSWIMASTDSTNAYILGFNSAASSSGPFTIKYYLLRKRSR